MFAKLLFKATSGWLPDFHIHAFSRTTVCGLFLSGSISGGEGTSANACRTYTYRMYIHSIIFVLATALSESLTYAHAIARECVQMQRPKNKKQRQLQEVHSTLSDFKNEFLSFSNRKTFCNFFFVARVVCLSLSLTSSLLPLHIVLLGCWVCLASCQSHLWLNLDFVCLCIAHLIS